MWVDWVRDGAAAEAALHDAGFAIVLLDLALPGAEGLDLLKSARRRGVDTPILIITARGAVDDRVSASTSAPIITCSSLSRCANSPPA